MIDDPKRAEQRGYSRGYYAGRKKSGKRGDAALNPCELERAEGLFRQQVFCAALQGAINGHSGKLTADYVRGCKQIADEALRQFCGQIVA